MSTQANKQLVEDMYEGLNQNVLGLMEKYWSRDMVWIGPAGIGTMNGLDEFEHVYRAPFLHAFPDKVGQDIVRLAEGDWVAAFGYQTTSHAEEWLGIPGSGQQIKMRYMDFWRVEEREGENGPERKLVENHVLIDILGVLEQAGYDVNRVLKFVGSKPPEFFEDVE